MVEVLFAKGNEQRCMICYYTILKDELFMNVERHDVLALHLRCFTSKFPVDFDEDRLILEHFSEGEIATVKKWVDSWNLQFRVVIPEKCLRKAVKTKSPSFRRILLEVFVYLTPTEIEQLAAFACKDWLHVTRDEELWRRQHLAQFPAPAENCCYRELAITRRWECCWHCGKKLTLKEVANVCPLRGRWLCISCFREEDGCRIKKLRTLCKRWCITYNLVKVLQVPTFRCEGAKAVYMNEIRNLVLPYAFSRRQKLINALKTNFDKETCRKVMKIIKSKALDEMYTAAYSLADRDLKPLYEFYGLAEEENFNRSVRKVVRRLTALRRQ